MKWKLIIFFTKKWSIRTAGILTSTCQGKVQHSWPYSNSGALQSFLSPCCVSSPRAKSSASKLLLGGTEFSTYQWVMDCGKASRKILSYTHRKRLNSMSELFSPKVNPQLQYIWESQFHRCQHFCPPFSANLQTWCFIGGQEVQKQNCIDTTLQVNFKHLSTWAQISYGTPTKHQTWCK